MKKSDWLIFSVFALFVFIFLYLNSCLDKINFAIADYYFKKNNIESAVKFYEKAFDRGSNDSKARNNYLNILINSPLDADAQNRLMKFIDYAEDDGAKYKATSFLENLRYEIYKKYPGNYITRATYNQKIIRWTTPIVTYGYKNSGNAPDYFQQEIDSAFLAWENSLGGIVKFKKTDKNPEIVIRFDTSKPMTGKDTKYIAATTKPIIISSSLKNMVMNFNTNNPDGKNFSKEQVYNTALHEIGHALGFMGHSGYPKNVMYMSTDTSLSLNGSRRILTDDDINTIKLLYAIKPDISNTKSPKGEYTKYIILGNDSEVTSAKMTEAKNYIKKAPHLPSGYIDLADTYVAQGEYYNAAKALHRALLFTNDVGTVNIINYNLALINFYAGDYDTAEDYLSKSGDLRRQETSLHLLAQIYASKGEKKEAVTIYKNLILKNPDNIEYVIGLTNIYVKHKEYFKARAVLKNFVRKNPNEKNNPRFNSYGIIKLFL